MVRTQIQLTEEQVARLKQIAAARHKPMAEVIRQAVDVLIKTRNVVDREDRFQKAIEAAGRFHSGLRDVSAQHDQYLAEVFQR